MVRASGDAAGLATLGVLGILGVRHRSETFLQPGAPPRAPSGLGRCIITGASSGMGAEVAQQLAEAGASEVVMACRSLERCEKTRQELFRRCQRRAAETSKDGRVEAKVRAARRRQCLEVQRKLRCKALDLTSPKSIEGFVKDLGGTGAQPMVLVNNAGVMAGDLQMRTNHYGHFMLTQLLLPSMDPASIIVIMASRAHRQGSLACEDMGWGQVRKHNPDYSLIFLGTEVAVPKFVKSPSAILKSRMPIPAFNNDARGGCGLLEYVFEGI
eukprot:Skav236647  [mRNA]  locus=scaffold691:55509:56318:+ [translate_table: standard]